MRPLIFFHINLTPLISLRNFRPLTSPHICASLLYSEVDTGIFEQYTRPSNVWTCIVQKNGNVEKKKLRPLIFSSENLGPLKKHSGRVFPINNVHPLRYPKTGPSGADERDSMALVGPCVVTFLQFVCRWDPSGTWVKFE